MFYTMWMDGKTPESFSDATISQSLMRLEIARSGGRGLEGSDIERLCKAGHSDLSRVEFFGNLKIHDVRISSLQGANVRDARFIRCDLHDTSFNGVDLGRAKFWSSNVAGADFSSILIKGVAVDTLGGIITLPKTTRLQVAADIVGSVHACEDAEPRFSSIFFDGEYNHEGKHFGEGVVLKSQGVILGVLKLNKEGSLLATQTVKDQDGNVLLWRGGLYEVHHPHLVRLQMFLEKRDSAVGQKEWPSVDLDNFTVASSDALPVDSPDYGKVPSFKISFVRFLWDPAMYEELKGWKGILENSKNEIDI